ncbi:MAG: T9SS type A sorting domain-containing protein, partial [Ignavibacteriae bacterium]|nr:T9SS type A sorting domain-containing protein [Ignavibacteriota bacterium]
TYPFTIFDKTGSVLATAPSTNSGFVPASAAEWGTFKIRVGSFITAIQPVSSEVPKDYSLSQNYPNPFNPTTNMKFALPKDGNVAIKIYDILGNLVNTIYDGYKTAGIYNATFDGSNLSSGIYFYKITSGSFSDTKRMILLK